MSRALTTMLIVLLATWPTLGVSRHYRRFNDYNSEKAKPGIDDNELEEQADASAPVERKTLPLFSRAEKFALIRRQMQEDPKSLAAGVLAELERKMRTMANNNNGTKLRKKARRAARINRPWQRTEAAAESRMRWVPRERAVAIPPVNCPKQFDAVTQDNLAANARIYVFAGDIVYEVYRQENLQQKTAYYISDVFPNPPRRVLAALTNRRSGITILVGSHETRRYAWSHRYKQFRPTRRNAVQFLPRAIDFTPSVAFQWRDGHIILANSNKFVVYDAYWNKVLMSGKTREYFPNLPQDTVGLAYTEQNNSVNDSATDRSPVNAYMFALLTASHQLQFYDARKWKVVQAYPLAVSEFLACLSSSKLPTNTTRARPRT